MITGILGGSFDPVHNGHTGIAEEVLKEGLCDRVLFIPAAHQPFKLDRTPASGTDRVNMINLAIEGKGNMEVSTFELDREGNISYTINTLEYFRSTYKEDEIRFICGADSFLKIDTWTRAEDIISGYPLIIAVRPGYDNSEVEEMKERLEAGYGAEIYIIENEPVNVSSTEIRKMVKDGTLMSCPDLSDRVKEYIIEQGIYN